MNFFEMLNVMNNFEGASLVNYFELLNVVNNLRGHCW